MSDTKSESPTRTELPFAGRYSEREILEAMWTATEGFKGILNDLQRDQISVETVALLRQTLPTGDDALADAMTELKAMGFMRMRIEVTDIRDSDPLLTPAPRKVRISVWRKQASGNVLYGTTLAEAMSAVREWKDRQ